MRVNSTEAMLFEGGTIWTGTGETVDALFIDNGVVVAVGDAARSAAQATGSVNTVHLDGGFLMPSFGDGHAHPLFGGLEAAGPQVRQCRTVDEIIDEVKRFADDNPGDDWIVGASYDSSLVAESLFDATWLDAAVPDRPVMLRALDYHTVWCNSVALSLAGITADTEDPHLGEIPRRADGSVLGTLREWGAVDLVTSVIPPRSAETGVTALRAASDYYLARGVTWVQDAWVEPHDVDTYLQAAAAGALRVRYNLALYADPRHFDTQVQDYADARRKVQEAASPVLTANTVKFFADGVIENATGALLEPYCSALHNHGMRVWEGDELARAARDVDAQGFQIHIHAIGDAAVRQALDAIEFTIQSNGPADRRPVIAHAQLIDAKDLSRFAELGVTATMQPLWAQMDPVMHVLTVPRLGATRAERQYAMNSVDRSGAHLAFGSDWPVTSGAPLDGIAVAVSRQNASGEPASGWVPEEVMSVDAALTAYTSSVARQAFADREPHPWGTIVAGSSADLVRLSCDPRTVRPREISDIEVVATYLKGRQGFDS